MSVEALAEQFGVTLQTVRRDVKLLADAGLLARFHGGARVPSSTTENIAYRQRQQLNEDAKRRIARAVAQGRARRLLADPQHRHHHRGHRARAAAAQGPARDHEQPERGGDPVGQPRLRSDRRRRRRARARPRHRRRGDGRFHPPVQGRHRPDRHLGHRGRRHAARLRLPRSEGGARDRRAFARGLAGRRPQQVQPRRRWSSWAGSTRSTRCSPTRPPPPPFEALLAEAGVHCVVAAEGETSRLDMSTAAPS